MICKVSNGADKMLIRHSWGPNVFCEAHVSFLLGTSNRIEKNLKIVSKTLLVDLPDDQSFTVQEFVDMQRKHIVTRSRLLQVWRNFRLGLDSQMVVALGTTTLHQAATLAVYSRP